ncbi:iron-containing alcohol dehydrogenase [Arthrobacter sp. GCM10027362]|uniref:iron-containing alcohol dehydrogenase n=1 Tax=Arthrobacter sp. GCM10027362 TaxID=3273379 RepID=UPI0036735E98
MKKETAHRIQPIPNVLAFNAPAAPQAAARIATALGQRNAIEGLNQLRKVLGAPTALRDYGLKQDNLEEAADMILPAIPSSNPRATTRKDLLAILRAAWSGTAPTSEQPQQPLPVKPPRTPANHLVSEAGVG